MEAENLLHRKRADFEEIDHVYHENNILIFSDKTMTISHDSTHVYMSSKWWGTVKNSLFTLDGMRGSTKLPKHGKVELNKIVEYSPKGPIVDVHKHNKVNLTKKPEETSLQFLGRYIQAKTGDSISYGVINKTGPDHAPTITVKLILPGNQEFTGKGSNKKFAANDAAEKALKELGI